MKSLLLMVVRVAGALLALLLGLLLFSTSESPPLAGQPYATEAGIAYPAVVAHRGLSGLAPEETAVAYRLARALGVDYLEADVQRTRDGVLVAFHDDSVARTTNAASRFPERAEAGIGDFTWAELAQLDAGSWFNEAYPERARPAYAGLRILRIDELLEIAGNDGPGLYLETKAPEQFPGIEEELVALLAARGFVRTSSDGPARLIFQSFSIDSLRRLKELAPHVPRIYLIGTEMEAEQGWDQLLEAAAEVGDGVGPVGYLAYPWYSGPAHERGLVIHPYTVNLTWQMQLLSFFGSDGFFTDRSDLLLAFYGRPVPDVEGILADLGY
ncbi:MAG: glycerophosphodiester phosphodiesterase [Spirochaetales bacterium]|nr:hypothetical protein [Leptospiraceae bacterium]MCP5482215.1 glycerophosphodiester phosphodiesterase [Spirochaetales bacterium]MCP5484673.1 glycerophosphodiester phosphodiesterase [Spirochaetales bacterium]